MIFLIGSCVAESIKINSFNGGRLFIIGVILFVIKSITPLKEIQLFCDISVGMLSISLIFIFNIFIKYCDNLCRILLVKVGSISLESYLFNIFLLQAVKYWKDIFLSNESLVYRLGLYIVIMILGLILSYLSQRIINIIIKKWRNIRCQHLQEKL